MTDKIHENWIASTVPSWEEIKPPQVSEFERLKKRVKELKDGMLAEDVIDKQAAEIDRLTKQCNDYAQEVYKTRVEAETLEQHYKCEIDALRTLLRGLNPYLRRSELPKELYEIILAEMKWEQT